MGIRIRQTFFFYICVVLKLRVYSQGNFVFDSANIQINALNINTRESEFGPFKIDNRLYYTSSRERRVGVVNLDRATNRQMLDLYSGILKDSVTVVQRKPLTNSINTSLNQGSAFFDKSTSRLYYSGNVATEGPDGKHKLAIFSSELKNNKFLKPRIELILPDTFQVSHPAVYNNKLYFSSNMKGGKGKADLYVAELVEGKWANIKNLEELNSPYNDYFPFVVSEKEIYFSSDRPGGFGKLDIYKSVSDSGETRIRNLGRPVNSVADDYGIYIDPSQDKGYFTTTRNNNQDDIYYFQKTWPSFNDCVAAIREKYCFDVTDEKSLDTDSINGYFYEWDFGDGGRQKGISATHCYLEPGKYTINLNIIDVSTKAVFLNQTSVDLTVDSLVQLKINALDTMLVNRKFTINTLGTYLPDKKILGYYFEVDDKRLRTESFQYSFPKTGKYKIKLGVEYEDRLTKARGLMCSTLDVTCVDSAAWLPFEQRKLDEVIAKFQARNIRGNQGALEDMNFDAELTVNANRGLSRAVLSDKIDDFLSTENARIAAKNLGNDKNGMGGMDEDAELAFAKKQQAEKDAFYKNLGNNKDGLSGMDEEAELAFKKKQQAEKDAFYKNLGNNKDGLGSMSEDAELSFSKKQQAEKDAFYKNLGNNKDGLSGMDEEAELAFKKKQQEEKDAFYKSLANHKNGLGNMNEDAELNVQSGESDGAGRNIPGHKNVMHEMSEEAELVIRKNPFDGKTLRGNIDTLLNLNEEASITFRVHLGKSNSPKDTAILNEKGIFGIKEDLVNNEYYYTYGDEKKVNNIEKYYRKAVAAGVREPVIIAYRNNIPVANQYRNFKQADFGMPVKKEEKPVATVKEKIKALFKKKKEEPPVAVATPSVVEQPTEQPDLVADAGKTAPAETKKKPAAQQPDTAKAIVVAETRQEPPQMAAVEPVKEKPVKTPPPVKEPEKKNSYIDPVPMKPDDVKLEDAHTPEGEVAVSAKTSLAAFVEKFGESSAPDLQFRVQISAFKYRNRYEFPHLSNLGAIENTLTEGGITRITIGGQFSTYKQALEHNKKVIAAGQKDAFVTAFYKGKRVYIENLEKMGIFVK